MSGGSNSNVHLQKERLDALYADIKKLDSKESEINIRLQVVFKVTTFNTLQVNFLRLTE